MSKKILSLISVLFLVSVLAVSCSNADKTGSDSSTSKGLGHYAGTWNFKEANPGTGKGTITILEDGSVSFEIQQQPPYTSKDVTDKGNETYEAKFIGESDAETLLLTLKFNDDTNGSYEVKITYTQETKTGTLTKQK